MKTSSIQKVIKVGSSLAVTIPAKDAKYLGIVAGSEVQVDIKPITPKSNTHDRLSAEYEAFRSQYGEALDSLSGK